jgi:hypothetical protein
MKKAILSLASLVLFTLSTFPVRADSVLTTIEIGNGSGGAGGVAANPATNKIYVTLSGTNEIVVIDGKTGDRGKDRRGEPRRPPGRQHKDQPHLRHLVRLQYGVVQHRGR